MTLCAAVPVNIKAAYGSDCVVVHWSDGHVSNYPNELLRGYCPCAKCQGHGSTVSFVKGGNTEIVDIVTVGNYAIRITWGDRHDAGIYDFSYLRELCPCGCCNHPSQ